MKYACGSLSQVQVIWNSGLSSSLNHNVNSSSKVLRLMESKPSLIPSLDLLNLALLRYNT